MRFLELFLEILARLALVFFSLTVGVIFFTFIVSLFLPYFSEYMKIIGMLVAALSVFTAIYLFFLKLDSNEQLWKFLPNPLKKES